MTDKEEPLTEDIETQFLNDKGGVNGCLIASFGIFIIILGFVLIAVDIINQPVSWMAPTGLLLILFPGVFFVLYPLVRLFFGGQDSLVAKLATELTQAALYGAAANAIKKRSKKKK